MWKELDIFSQPRCPNCESLDVSFRGLKRNLAYGTIALGVPYPVAHLARYCNSCKEVWENPEDLFSENVAALQ